MTAVQQMQRRGAYEHGNRDPQGGEAHLISTVEGRRRPRKGTGKQRGKKNPLQPEAADAGLAVAAVAPNREHDGENQEDE